MKVQVEEARPNLNLQYESSYFQGTKLTVKRTGFHCHVHVVVFFFLRGGHANSNSVKKHFNMSTIFSALKIGIKAKDESQT